MTNEPYSTIDVSGRGAALTGTGATYELTVLTGDPTSRIVVVDERFDAVAKAAGSLVVKLPEGFYKVRVQRGASSIGFEDRLVVLDRDQSVSIEPPRFASPAPIGGSQLNLIGGSQVSVAHLAAREWLDAVTHVHVGKGAKIAMLARYAAAAQKSKPLIHPFAGLELLRADGGRVVDLVRAMPHPHVPDTKDPISICGIQVDPGAYVLRHRLADGRRHLQNIIVSKGWQITINIRRSEADIDQEERKFTRPGYLAFLMRRLLNDQSAQPAVQRESKDGPIDEDLLIDVARQGLADGVQLLSGNLYALYLESFDNPLVGLLGGLLLDLEREILGDKFPPEHAALFDGVVSKLRSMVGSQHPDVEALSFRCRNVQLAHRGAISTQPMFHRSWRIILEAASNNQNLVPLNLWEQTAAAATMPPYLIWMEGATRQTHLRDLKVSAASIASAPAVVAKQRAESPAAPAPFAPGSSADAEYATPGRGASSEAAATAVRSTTIASARQIKKALQQRFALQMNVPVNALAQLMATGASGLGSYGTASRTKKAMAKRAAASKSRRTAKRVAKAGKKKAAAPKPVAYKSPRKAKASVKRARRSRRRG